MSYSAQTETLITKADDQAESKATFTKSGSVEAIIQLELKHSWKEEFKARKDEFVEQFQKHGAIRLRGLPEFRPEHIEYLASINEIELSDQYRGASPRIARSQYVHTASELPSYYPIPQHPEMSFLSRSPQYLFFGCQRPNPNSHMGGQTPITDLAKVAQLLPTQVRERFEKLGVLHIRRYRHQKNRLDPFQLKTWKEIFCTEDRSFVQQDSELDHQKVTWTDEYLMLEREQSAFVTLHGQKVWFNHAVSFHPWSVYEEYCRIVERFPTLRNKAAKSAAWGVCLALSQSKAPSLDCKYGNGLPIPREDMNAARDAVWEATSFEPWHKGDIIWINNHRVGHGRMPYQGPREVLVAWSQAAIVWET